MTTIKYCAVFDINKVIFQYGSMGSHNLDYIRSILDLTKNGKYRYNVTGYNNRIVVKDKIAFLVTITNRNENRKDYQKEFIEFLIETYSSIKTLTKNFTKESELANRIKWDSLAIVKNVVDQTTVFDNKDYKTYKNLKSNSITIVKELIKESRDWCNFDGIFRY